MPLKVTVLHATIRLGARRTNMKRLVDLASKAISDDDTDFLVMPPYSATGPIVGYYSDQKVRTIVKGMAERISEVDLQLSPTLALISRISEEYGIYIMAGPVVERAGPRLYLTTAITAPDGRLVGKYRKIALTRKELEAGLTPGKEVLVVETKSGIKVGVMTDEDIMYPEVGRALYYSGADLVISTMLPYHSEFFRLRSEPGTGVLTLDLDQVMEAVDMRSRENRYPMILVGGAVEGVNGSGLMAFTPTLMAEPDEGVIKDKVRLYDDLDMPVRLEVDRAPLREARPSTLAVLRSLCKGGETHQRKGGREEE